MNAWSANAERSWTEGLGAYLRYEKAIQVGFMQIKTLHEVVKQIVPCASRTPYQSLHDFLDRVKPDVAQAKLLIKAGCFDWIAGDLTRLDLTWRLVAFSRQPTNRYLPVPREYSALRQCAQEWELFGFPLSRHPLDLLDVLGSTAYTSAYELDKRVGRTITLLGW